jgi:hypothetical protein
MRFRLPYKRDELLVDEKNQRPADNEASTDIRSKEESLSEVVNPDFQHGVQAAQAMTQVWSFSHIVTAYVL